MAIALRGSTSNGAANGVDVALDLSAIAGLAQNDIVVVAYSISDNDGINHSADLTINEGGWTSVHVAFVDDTIDLTWGVFLKRMGASPDTTATCDVHADYGADAATSAVAMAFSGVDTTTAQDVAAVPATGLSTYTADPGQIGSFTKSGVWVVTCAGSANRTLVGTNFTAAPSGYSGLVSRHDVDTNESTAAIAYEDTPADPENPGTFTHDGTDSTSWCWGATTIALRPAPSGVPHTNVAIIGF